MIVTHYKHSHFNIFLYIPYLYMEHIHMTYHPFHQLLPSLSFPSPILVFSSLASSILLPSMHIILCPLFCPSSKQYFLNNLDNACVIRYKGCNYVHRSGQCVVKDAIMSTSYIYGSYNKYHKCLNLDINNTSINKYCDLINHINLRSSKDWTCASKL